MSEYDDEDQAEGDSEGEDDGKGESEDEGKVRVEMPRQSWGKLPSDIRSISCI